MKKSTARWIKKAEKDLKLATEALGSKEKYYDHVCYLCQQAIEKYLKALLEESGLPIVKTHNLAYLLDRLVPSDKTLRKLRRGTATLSRYAVNLRYPGEDATARQARVAHAKALLFRSEIRQRLGLPNP
jgi:HEPN domain-containing protein